MKFQVHDVQLFDQKYLLFGRNSAGESVSVLVQNHPSYFYIKPRNASNPRSYQHVDNVITELSKVVFKRLEPTIDDSCKSHQCCCNTSLSIGQFGPDLASICKHDYGELYSQTGHIYRGKNVNAKTMIGYQPNNKTFVKVMCKTYGIQKLIKYVAMQKFNKEYEILELGIDPIMRFMADIDLVGHGFIEIAEKDLIGGSRVTLCTYEYSIQNVDCIRIVDETTNFPVHLLSYDIECCSFEKNKFPKATDDDPVIQIGIVAEKLFTDDEKPYKAVFCLEQTDDIEHGEILCFPTEIELLQGFFKYAIENFQCDVITGYNSNQFDMPYLLGRARKLGYGGFEYFSKMRSRRMYNWEQRFQSAQAGTRMTVQYNSPGVVHFDVFNFVKKTMNLSSYTLNNVSKELLKDQKKEDMEYKNIAPYFKDGPEKRGIIASYCLNDTVLVSRLIDTQKMMVNNIEFSRICGVLLQHSFEKGVSYKITRKLLEYTMKNGFLIPTFERNDDGHQIIEYYNEIDNDRAEYLDDLLKDKPLIGKKSKIDHYFAKCTTAEPGKKRKRDLPRMKQLKFQGAFVLPPQAGFHENPVATLDFASLYPSEMRSKNMCTSTLLKSEEEARKLGLKEGEYERVASGFIYVKKSKFEGILPKIETELHFARKAAKKELKAAKKTGNAVLTSVLDGKQLAIKLIMNSIYGYCGSRTSPIAALPVAVSITAQGRHDIMETKKWVETNFKHKFCTDAPGEAEVIYGDTDSVMVKFKNCESLAQSFAYAEECEKRINSLELKDNVAGLFQQPMYLEFEKVFKPYYLLKKKKYIGLKYEAGELEKPPKLDFKGIEVIRRDWCTICTNTQQEFINRLIVQSDKKGAIEFVQQRVADLMSGAIDNSELVLSKKLSKFNYKNMQPHVEVAKKLQHIDPMNAPELGDRVNYFISMNEHKKIAMKAEPVQMFGKALVDYGYYLEKQLRGPMIRLLEPLIGEVESKRIFKKSKSKALQKSQKIQAYQKLFNISN